MKLKQLPEDFFVEELADVTPGSEGDFSLYRLEKTGWTTPDALAVIRRRWKIDRRRLSFAGLKDRHAFTVQYLTIFRGPQRKLTHQGIQLEFLGKLGQSYTSHDFRGNRFRLVVRDLTPAAVEQAGMALGEVSRDGVPNYFDDQRFGSVSEGEFVAKALVLGDLEKALRLALTGSYEHDRAEQKRAKAILTENWGNWQLCKSRLPRFDGRNVIDFLVHNPNDFRGAVIRLRPDLRTLYLSAYQSHLWNRMLAQWLREHVAPEHLREFELRMGPAPMHCNLAAPEHAELAASMLPLPTARGAVDPADSNMILMHNILVQEGLTREQLKVKGLRDLFFSRGTRAALCTPAALEHVCGEDELNKGRQKMTLAFELPRGSYATLIVKRAFENAASAG